jgi:Phage integrase family
MNHPAPLSPGVSRQRSPWNKGKMTGPKPPLRSCHVWAIRAKLQLEKRTRDLAMFNLAIDSKLRGCDLVALRVEDVAPNGYALDRATVRQRKTGRPVRFELSEPTRQALEDYLRTTGCKTGECLFPGRRSPDRSLTTRQYARLVSEWVRGIGLDTLKFATHSMRRTKVTLIYRRTGNLQDRKYGSVSGRRGRRCPRDCREDRCVNSPGQSSARSARPSTRELRPPGMGRGVNALRSGQASLRTRIPSSHREDVQNRHS